MQLKNTQQRYGWLSISLHWLAAILIIALFALGLWMTSLNYYHTWYHLAPKVHMTLGVILLVLMVVRVVWRLISPPPAPISTHSQAVRVLSKLGHISLYAFIFMVMIAGYLIFTADGEPIVLLGDIEIPATIYGMANQADVAGWIHLYGAWLLILAAAGHALAALKHHFIDKDATLKRMFGGQE